jgi:hypothetical protein
LTLNDLKFSIWNIESHLCQYISLVTIKYISLNLLFSNNISSHIFFIYRKFPLTFWTQVSLARTLARPHFSQKH